MAVRADAREELLRGIYVIDGGVASELEYRGARIDGPLWSAHVLEDEPEKVAAVHRAYIQAGSQCIATCSYQVSRMGYAEIGLPPERADGVLLRSVALARSVVAEFPGRRASLLPASSAHTVRRCTMAPSTTATTTAPMPTWSASIASALKCLPAQPIRRLLICSPPTYLLLKPSLRLKRSAPWGQRSLPGRCCQRGSASPVATTDRKSTRLNSSHANIS